MATSTSNGTTKIERRAYSGIEFREKGEGDPKDSIGTLNGYAAVFNSDSEDLGWFIERIRPGAFKESLERGDDVRAFGHHMNHQVLGRRSAKTLTLSEDEKGLKFSISLPDTTVGRDVLTSVRRGDVDGMSFGFSVVADDWTKQTRDAKTVYLRELITVDLFEISVVSFPAYTAASVSEARSLAKSMLDQVIPRIDPKNFEARDRRIKLTWARMKLWKLP